MNMNFHDALPISCADAHLDGREALFLLAIAELEHRLVLCVNGHL